MAVVSWGCVLRVKWVESEEIKKWVESHALRTPQTAEFTNDGTYNEGTIVVTHLLIALPMSSLSPTHGVTLLVL